MLNTADQRTAISDVPLSMMACSVGLYQNFVTDRGFAIPLRAALEINAEDSDANAF
jgi:hypothetical protein